MAAYTRCLRCAGAPRRPASGSGLSLHIPSRHAVLYDPGELDIDIFQSSDDDIGLRRDLSGSALPKFPLHAGGGTLTRLHWFASATACQVARPPVRIKPASRPPGAFTSGLPTRQIPLPDMTTTVTGLLCWRDSHPLEWQLASLHQIRMCRFPASGSSWKSFARGGEAVTIRDSPVKKVSKVAPSFRSCQCSYPLSFRGQVCETQSSLSCFPSTVLSSWHPSSLDRVPVSPVPRCHRSY